MDVGFPRGVPSIDPDILIQEIVEYQNVLIDKNLDKLNRMVDGLKSELQNYLDRNHPGLAVHVPKNGPHFQIVKSSLEELALMMLESQEGLSTLELCSKLLNEVNSKITVLTQDSISKADFVEPMSNTLAVVKQMLWRCEWSISKHTLEVQKMLDMAKAIMTIHDFSHFGKLRKGIAAVIENKANWLFTNARLTRDLIANAKDREDNLMDLLNIQERVIKDFSLFEDFLMEAHTQTNIPPDVSAAFYHLFFLPNYIAVLLGRTFNVRMYNGTTYKCTVLTLVDLMTTTKDWDVFEEDVDMLKSRVCKILQTLPYEVLNQVLEMTPSSTEEGKNFRRKMLEVKAIHFVLKYFEVQTAVASLASQSQSSATSTLKQEKAFHENEAREEKVTCLLNVLINFIGTQEEGNDDHDIEFRTEVNKVLLKNSSFMTVLSKYLERVSGFDFCGNVPLYKAIFKLLGSIISIPQLQPLLISGEGRDSVILELLKKLTTHDDSSVEGTDCSEPLHVATHQDFLDMVQLFRDIPVIAAQVEKIVAEILRRGGEDKNGSREFEMEELACPSLAE